MRDIRQAIALRKYRRTQKGLVRNMFSHIKERCEKYNRMLEFTSDELLDWCRRQPEFATLYSNWVEDDFSKRLKPSVDRRDPLKGYTWENIQLTTYEVNRVKGDLEKEVLWRKPISQYDRNGNFIKSYPSIKQAVKDLNLKQGLISHVLLGERNHTGGYIFRYNENPELLNPIK